jgi:hypothetical protein
VNTGDVCQVANLVIYSSERWLAGKEVLVVKIDEGESWEHPIVQVQCEDEKVWMDPRDLVQVHPLRHVLERVAQELGTIPLG